MAKDSRIRYKKPKKASRKACESYKDLFEEEKNKKQEYGCNCYKYLPEHEKQKLIGYRKKI